MPTTKNLINHHHPPSTTSSLITPKHHILTTHPSIISPRAHIDNNIDYLHPPTTPPPTTTPTSPTTPTATTHPQFPPIKNLSPALHSFRNWLRNNTPNDILNNNNNSNQTAINQFCLIKKQQSKSSTSTRLPLTGFPRPFYLSPSPLLQPYMYTTIN